MLISLSFYPQHTHIHTHQMTKAFLPHMKAKNHGHIVTIASALGLFSTACVEVGRTTLPLNRQQRPFQT